MNLNNLSMNYKILLGISSITILTLIYQYIKNFLNPNNRLLEGQDGVVTRVGAGEGFGSLDRYGTNLSEYNDNGQLSKSGSEFYKTEVGDARIIKLLEGIYNELGEFNHIYQERMYENLFPTQMRKIIVHLSSIDYDNGDSATGTYIFDLATEETSGMSGFSNIINIKLLGAQIPYIPHNIYKGDKGNNLLKFTNPDPPIKIEEGKYTIYSLINKINSLLTNITLGFDPITQNIKITNTSGKLITIDNSTYPLFKRLGFHENGTLIDGSYNSSYTSPSIPDISIHYIDILTPDIHPRAYSKTVNNDTVLKRIPLTGPLGDLIYYEANHSDYISQELFIPDISSNLTNLTINLKRHDGSAYDLKNLHFDLKMEITELVDPTLLNGLATHMRRDKTRFQDTDGAISISGITGE